MRGSIDRPLLVTAVVLVALGFLIFSSASLGLLARDGAQFSSVAFNQIFFGIFLGSIACFIMTRIPYRMWKQFAIPLFIASLILTLLVFVPGLGLEHGGARRWIVVFGISFQPVEFLKIGFIIFYAAWLSYTSDRIHTFKYGLVPLLTVLGIVGAVLLAQPDTDTFLVIASAGLAMYLAAGARWRDFGVLLCLLIVLVAALAFFRPYIMDRIMTFFDPMADPQGSGYQLKQSLIAVGSGELVGRGFGQSIQKFSFLPEPIGDSIFSVAAEEFGFIGSAIIVLLFLYFLLRGLTIAARAPDRFGGLIVTGIVVMVVTQSFVNIGAMVGLLPLSGIPLLFISHGGTAMFFALAEVGLVLNVSRYKRRARAVRKETEAEVDPIRSPVKRLRAKV
jgi:cell division protein FtsW